jgi:large subunit ribosomal protein L15
MPFHRRLPKKGFRHTQFKTVYSVVNLQALNSFENDARITPRLLREKGLIRSLRSPVKILGDGELTVKVNVVAHAFSRKARRAIEQQGGTCETIG